MNERTFDPLQWPLAAYGTIVRGDESTSEDQVAEAVSADIARRIVACWNACSGVPTEALELPRHGSLIFELLYEYAVAGVKAESMGLTLAATREDFVLRDKRTNQEFGRCASLDELNRALDRRVDVEPRT